METVLRVTFAYFFILLLLRILGKRELAQLTPFELVMLLLIPEIASQAILREDFSITNAVIALTTLAMFVYLTSELVYRYKAMGALFEGKPSLLVDRGRPVNDTMDLERISAEELAAELRRVGIARVEDVKWAVLETGGKISVIGRGENKEHAPPEENRIR